MAEALPSYTIDTKNTYINALLLYLLENKNHLSLKLMDLYQKISNEKQFQIILPTNYTWNTYYKLIHNKFDCIFSLTKDPKNTQIFVLNALSNIYDSIYIKTLVTPDKEFEHYINFIVRYLKQKQSSQICVFEHGTQLLDKQFFKNLIDAALIYIGNAYISSCKILDPSLDVPSLVTKYKEMCDVIPHQKELMQNVQQKVEQILNTTAYKSMGGYRRNRRKTRSHKKGKGRTRSISRKRRKIRKIRKIRKK